MKTLHLIYVVLIFLFLWGIVMISIFCSKCSKKTCETYTRKSRVKNFTIYGERCSGTNFLEYAMDANFDLELIWKYGWKHFFGDHIDFSDSDETLFLCIYRDPVDWLNSLYRKKYHVPKKIQSVHDFLTKPMKSMRGKQHEEEIPHTRNLETGKIYKNIFELRAVKLNYLIEKMPKNVKHCEVFSYEEFCSDYDKIIKYLQKKYRLKIKTKNFPKPVRNIYRGGTIVKNYKPYEQEIPRLKIIPFLEKDVEEKAGYKF